ncbi:type IV secretion system protein, partial [Caballeronia calidae]|uniref:type IV secretion system protein n=1 Tax=Caballeronia calidae TaxID=1777139 RepID=UPI000AA2DA81
LLLFESTKSLFTKWIGSVINYGLVTVLFAAVFGLLLYFFKAAIGAAAANNPNAPVMVAIVTCVLVLVITWFMLKEIPHMASSWGQGVSADIFRHMRQNRDGGGGSGGSSGGKAGRSSIAGGGAPNSAGAGANATAAGPSAQSPTNGLARGSRRSA